MVVTMMRFTVTHNERHSDCMASASAAHGTFARVAQLVVLPSRWERLGVRQCTALRDSVFGSCDCWVGGSAVTVTVTAAGAAAA